MKKLLAIALICNAAVLTLPAHAEGAFAGVSVDRTKYDLDVTVGGVTSSSSNRTTGYKLFGGYDFTQNWAVEGGYADFGSGDNNVNGTGIRLKPTAFYVAGKGIIPLNDAFSLFGKLGASRNHSELTGTGLAQGLSQTSNRTSLYAGIGAQYNLNKNVAFTLEYENFGKIGDSGSKLDTISIGARYSF
jgi:OOP family OmpA-OmpF porin